MFTGIVEGTARCRLAERSPEGLRLELDLGPLHEGVQIGDSVALDGCCLTAVAIEGPLIQFDVVLETLSKTKLGNIEVGSRVNVERSLKLGDRLGGHLVTGHVDAVGRIAAVVKRGSEWDIDVEAPEELRRYFVPMGSVTVDGISLTIAEVKDSGFRVAIIPHTREVTTFGDLRQGGAVNLEVDVLGKWVARLLAHPRPDGVLELDDLARGVS